MNKRIVVIVVTLVLSGQIQAQSPPSHGSAEALSGVEDTLGNVIEWGGGGGDNCKIVVLTEAGYHLSNSVAYRGIAATGFLVKTGIKDAVGADFFVSLDDEFIYGVEARYRHWFSRHHSIDFGFGLPISQEDSYEWVASPFF